MGRSIGALSYVSYYARIMTKSVTVRFNDVESARALDVLTATSGAPTSDAIRAAVINEAKRVQQAELRAEAERFNGDSADAEEMRAIQADMEDVRAW